MDDDQRLRVRRQPDESAVAHFVSRGRLERVMASGAHARHLLREARRHLASAAVLAETEDVSAAFVTAYDAARKALTAILAVQGLRAKGGNGGHAVLLDAVKPQFPDHTRVLLRFDWLRNVRNATQYPDFQKPTATPADLVAAIPAATEIVDLAEAYVVQYETYAR
jgi:HEPN domain-containing protein